MRKDSAGESTQVETHMTSKKIKKIGKTLYHGRRGDHMKQMVSNMIILPFFRFLLSFLIACNHYTHQKQK
jgi:hypothetical protein